MLIRRKCRKEKVKERFYLYNQSIITIYLAAAAKAASETARTSLSIISAGGSKVIR